LTVFLLFFYWFSLFFFLSQFLAHFFFPLGSYSVFSLVLNSLSLSLFLSLSLTFKGALLTQESSPKTEALLIQKLTAKTVSMLIQKSTAKIVSLLIWKSAATVESFLILLLLLFFSVYTYTMKIITSIGVSQII
jgi:hypothetical protein